MKEPAYIDSSPDSVNMHLVDRVYADIWEVPVVIISTNGKPTVDYLIKDFDFMGSNIRVLIKSSTASSGEDVVLYCLFRENTDGDKVGAMEAVMKAEEWIM